MLVQAAHYKKRIGATIATSLFLACSSCGQDVSETDASKQVVNIYSWSDYIAPETIPKFEAETGIKVNYDTYDSTYLVDTKLLSGRTGYDVVMHAGQNSTRLIPLGIFTPLDKSRLQHWDDQDPDVVKLLEAYEGTTDHSAIYTWGSTGIAYNLDMVLTRAPEANLESGDLLFKPEIVSKLADCGVTMLDEADDVFPMALTYMGRDPNSTDAEDVQAVEDLIARVRPFIRYFSSTKMINDLPNQEVCVAMSWSGDYAQAAARAVEVGRNIDLRYSVPIEGSRLWFDGMYIPSDANNKNNAYKFIDFMMRPENIAAVSNFVYYANGVVTSKPFLLPEVLNNPGIYPDESVRDRLFIATVLPLKQERVRNRAFARIKSGI